MALPAQQPFPAPPEETPLHLLKRRSAKGRSSLEGPDGDSHLNFALEKPFQKLPAATPYVATMRKEPLLWASLCLLLSGAFRPLDAAPETQDTDDTGTMPSGVAPAHPSCEEPAKTGPCRAAFPRFFFNVQTGQCEAFVYGGCRGNDNRFISLEECMQKCLPAFFKRALQ